MIYAHIDLKNYKLWSPAEPNIYFVNIEYGKDSFSTYFTMRHFGVDVDEKGIPRLTLNHKPYFMNGVLDQGYYPESLMTPPSDDAMIFDIETIKNMGFNMIRKHCKLEPMRWYFHCDRIGMIVWQDIVNGGTEYNMNMICHIPTVVRPFGNSKDKNKIFLKFTGRNTEKSKEVWRTECADIINQLYSVPCIGQWCLFNEGWGQFDANTNLEFAKKYAPEGCKLYYNDFNEYMPGKREAIVALTEEINADGHYIDGIGMQSHLGTDVFPTANVYEKALKMFTETGLDVQITELDQMISSADKFEEQAQYYSDIMDVIMKYRDSVSAVVFWGTTDDMSWRASKYPLLFNEDYTAKPCFYSIVDGIEPTQETSTEATVSVRGDVNADGVCDVMDVILLQKWLLGIPGTHLADWKAGDLCQDGVLDVFDLCMMERILVK